MAFTPPSSIAPATVVVGGAVAVTNFPAVQAVSGPLTDAELRAAPVVVDAGLEDLATEETLRDAAEALNDVGLTAILQRERLEP